MQAGLILYIRRRRTQEIQHLKDILSLVSATVQPPDAETDSADPDEPQPLEEPTVEHPTEPAVDATSVEPTAECAETPKSTVEPKVVCAEPHRKELAEEMLYKLKPQALNPIIFNM